MSPETMQQTGQMAELLRILRTVEGRISSLHKRLDVLDSNILTQQKRMGKDFLLAESDLIEMKKELSSFSYKISLLGKELSLSAPKKDIDALMKYIELWQPQEFLRRNEAEQLMQAKK